MGTFEVAWKAYGTATVQADSMEEAVGLVSRELQDWSGAGTDLDSVSIDGWSVEP